ncbi:MAG: helix-turn-helix transcriptional regulator [Cellulomonas sp.]|uniref:TetR/AcrR family transcriptional regulator n=1 Tax=Cellulomonas sp. TaxID=40001 RepID=UPI0018226441|nr:helix-turn-helix domain-containing protein [Cellulomonas sp.]NMM29572.1 helix-turn-helix transcriptional regulator [Cellulomonas sp.]
MSPRRARVLRDQGASDSPGALRRHLIDVTQRLLAAHGAAGLTTREIAREAHVADGLLYNHFAGKDDLVVTALVERAAELVEGFLAALPEPGAATLEENLHVLAQAVLELTAQAVPLVTGLLGQAALLGRLFDDIHDTQAGQVGPQAAFGAAVGYVRAEQGLGRAAADVEAAAVVELLFGACLSRAFVGQLGEREVAVPAVTTEALVGVLLRALQGPGSAAPSSPRVGDRPDRR